MHERGKLTIGPWTITWDPAYATPVGSHLTRAEWHVLLCDVTYTYGQHSATFEAGYGFDGASNPWLVRWVPGYEKHGWHFLATLPHDYVCDHPEKLPRPIGDGIFVSLLLAIAAEDLAELDKLERRRRVRQAWKMYAAVVVWTFIQAMRGNPLQEAAA